MKQIKKSLKVHLQHYKNLEVLAWNFFVRKLFCESFANFIRKDWLFSRIVDKGNVFSFEFRKTFQSSYSIEHMCMAASKNVVLKLIWSDRQSLLEAAYLSCLFVFGSIINFFLSLLQLWKNIQWCSSVLAAMIWSTSVACADLYKQTNKQAKNNPSEYP